MDFEKFLEIINDDKFDKDDYDKLVKEYGFNLISRFFSELLNTSELSEDYYDKCKYYLEDDLKNNNNGEFDYSKCKELKALRQYLHEMGQIPLLSIEEERAILVKLDSLKKLMEKHNEKYNIIELREQGKTREANELLKDYLKLEKEYISISNKFIESNLRLVISIAKHYDGPNRELLDLIQEGNIALRTALDKFDVEKGVKFSTYATWWIRQAITRTIHKHSRTIQLPVHKLEFIYKVDKATTLFEREYCKEPNSRELTDYIKVLVEKGIIKDCRYFKNLKPEIIDDLKQISQSISSLNSKIGDSDDTMDEYLVDKKQESIEELVEKKLMGDEIIKALGKIEPRARLVVILRNGLSLKEYMDFDTFLSCFKELTYSKSFYEKVYMNLSKRTEIYTLEEIAKIYGVTRERIRQIEFRSLRKIRYTNKQLKLLLE